MVDVKKLTSASLYLKAQGVMNFITAFQNEEISNVKKILKETLPDALKAFRADLGIYPLPNDDGYCNLAAFNDKRMVPSFLQNKWRGPYIDLEIHSWDLNKNNMLVDAKNEDIRYGVMVIPSHYFHDMTEIKKGAPEIPGHSRYCSVIALLPKSIAAFLKMDLGNSLEVREWDSRLAMVFYAVAPMQSFLHC
jgi:hypothetical protein